MAHSDDLDGLFRLYRQELQQMAYRRLRHPEAAADAVQDTFVRYVVARGRPDLPILHSPIAFLRRILSNLTLDVLAAERRRPAFLPLEEELADAAPGAERRVIARQELALLHAAILALPPRGREVFVLRRFGALTQAETARRLGIAPNTVEVHMVRALVALRRAVFGGRPS